MEAHALLEQNNFQVGSFGVGGHVKLPGPSAKEPNVYKFGTSYQIMMEDLEKKDRSLYTRNGILNMLRRNMAVKLAPQRWQDSKEQFDVAMTFQERVMEHLVEDMNGREQTSMRRLLVVNMDVKDNHEEAANAAPQALLLCQMIQDAEDWEDDIDEIMDKFEAQTGRRPLYTICFY
ncbi:hypothetical protein WJX84_000233 [Apatococcus fuscideae]